MHHAAIEEDMRGRPGLLDEAGEMGGDAGVGGVGQADFGEGGALGFRWLLVLFYSGQEAVQQDLFQRFATERGFD